jgi:hypothetical protein
MKTAVLSQTVRKLQGSMKSLQQAERKATMKTGRIAPSQLTQEMQKD